jgi:hypothetical protein
MRSGLPCTILAAVAEHEREAISAVAPFTGVRIETSWRAITRSSSAVAPFTGARIETDNLHRRAKQIVVAPFTGARIETLPAASGYRAPRVAPFTGARIETAWSAHTGSAKRRSLPSRGRGSKPYRAVDYCVDIGRSLHGWFSFSSARRMVATLSADAAARSSAVQRVRDRAALI